jgi:hypothetical protein
MSSLDPYSADGCDWVLSHVHARRSSRLSRFRSRSGRNPDLATSDIRRILRCRLSLVQEELPADWENVIIDGATSTSEEDSRELLPGNYSYISSPIEQVVMGALRKTSLNVEEISEDVSDIQAVLKGQKLQAPIPGQSSRDLRSRKCSVIPRVVSNLSDCHSDNIRDAGDKELSPKGGDLLKKRA